MYIDYLYHHHVFCAGVSVELNSIPISNYGLLGHGDIATDGSGDLVCRTDHTQCCRNLDSPGGVGHGSWYHPSTYTGSEVRFSYGPQVTGQIYHMRRGLQTILLRRDGGTGVTAADGIYRCEVADQSGVTQTRYVGLYTDGAGEI